MRCIRCGKNSNYKQRTANNSHCYNCGHSFAFEPAEMNKKITFTDPFFDKVLKDISAENTLYFTTKQFHYFFNKKLKLKATNREKKLIIILVLFIFFIIISEFFKSTYSKEIGDITSFLFTLLAIGSFYFIVANQVKTQTNQIFIISLEEINQCLNRWQEINGSLSYLLSSPNTEQFNPVNVGTNSYSFDRAIICDKPEIAQFLIKNNFHFENNCAVLSIDGYPESIFKTVIEMLKRNPDLQVYGLHDASPKGVCLTHELRNNRQWFKNSSVHIYDFGISPRQILKNSKYLILNTSASARETRLLSSEIKNNLTPKELSWLESGNFVELESFSPKSLLKIIARGVSILDLADSDELFIPLEDNSNLGSKGVYTYGFDSFG